MYFQIRNTDVLLLPVLAYLDKYLDGNAFVFHLSKLIIHSLIWLKGLKCTRPPEELSLMPCFANPVFSWYNLYISLEQTISNHLF